MSLFASSETSKHRDASHCSRVGTYLHGFLDNDPIREGLLKYVRERKDLPQPEEEFNYREFRSRQLNRLADLITQSIDMNEVKRIIGL